MLTENLVLHPFYVSFFFSFNFVLVIEIRTECKILLKQASNKDVKKYCCLEESILLHIALRSEEIENV